MLDPLHVSPGTLFFNRETLDTILLTPTECEAFIALSHRRELSDEYGNTVVSYVNPEGRILITEIEINNPY